MVAATGGHPGTRLGDIRDSMHIFVPGPPHTLTTPEFCTCAFTTSTGSVSITLPVGRQPELDRLAGKAPLPPDLSPAALRRARALDIPYYAPFKTAPFARAFADLNPPPDAFYTDDSQYDGDPIVYVYRPGQSEDIVALASACSGELQSAVRIVG